MTPTRPDYSIDPRHEAMTFILSIRRFARTAGIRNAATALRRQGLPITLTYCILLRNPLRAAQLLLAHWATRPISADDNLGDC